MGKKNKNKRLATRRWEEYYNEDDLEHWQQLMAVLGIDGHFGSKTQCKVSFTSNPLLQYPILISSNSL
jgi:hypothetical protein